MTTAPNEPKWKENWRALKKHADVSLPPKLIAEARVFLSSNDISPEAFRRYAGEYWESVPLRILILANTIPIEIGAFNLYHTSPDTLLVGNFDIYQPYQGCGRGTRALELLKEHARKGGYRRIRGELARKSISRLQKFYVRAGAVLDSSDEFEITL